MAAESWVLDGLSLTDGTDLKMEDAEFAPAVKRLEWVTSPNSDGAVLLEEPHSDNMVIRWRLRVPRQSAMDTSLGKLGELQDKLEEAQKNDDGIELVWTPEGSTQAYSLYVLSGQIVGVPMKLSGGDAGWTLRAPVVIVETVCKPFLYLPEENLGSTTSSLPLVTLALSGVKGDVPAEGRLVITDAASQARRDVLWGIESRHYNAATSLLIDSDSLVTSGFGGSQVTLSGAYDPNSDANDAISATLVDDWTAVCGTGNQSHVGVFRVLARVATNGNGEGARFRFAYQVGDGPFTTNAPQDVKFGDTNLAFEELDLGTITIPPASAGTQRWTGRVEGTDTDATSSTGYVDYLELIPVLEGYGRAIAVPESGSGVLTGRDTFAGLAASSALHGRTATFGGLWTSGGATTDFVAADAPEASDETLVRSTVSDASRRVAALGSTNYAAQRVRARIRWTNYAFSPSWEQGVIARYVDSSNYLMFVHTGKAGAAAGSDDRFYIRKNVAGTITNLALDTSLDLPMNEWYELTLTVYPTGTVIGEVRDDSGALLTRLVTSDSTLVTGGTLDDGKPGLIDYNAVATASTRYYDDFAAFTPPTEQVVIHSGQSVEFRHNTTIREDSGGTVYAGVPTRGSRFYVPAAGGEGRAGRVAVRARRLDVESSKDLNIADSTTVQVFARPRFRIPRGTP